MASGERQTETHQAERTTDGMGHVWTEESDLDRLDELEAEVARLRAERDDWRYRAQDVERFKARADRAEARVAELEAERDSYKRLWLEARSSIDAIEQRFLPPRTQEASDG